MIHLLFNFKYFFCMFVKLFRSVDVRNNRMFARFNFRSFSSIHTFALMFSVQPYCILFFRRLNFKSHPVCFISLAVI